MRDFKPEDLALVIGYRNTPHLVGSTVELWLRAEPGEDFIAPDGKWWFNDGLQPAWIVFVSASLDWAFVEERHLMPLRGDATPARQAAKEHDHA
ncbi:hypothetical protein [Pseudomonas oryzihabitans]|uniref:hypothetical protein n=1 Tax=Pseudomonas oryzihabitans TaxID=47885 RepID=UPI00241CD5C1|nr:hypothetical protein [Pseudomonas oryzihabitans]